ncbi:MAG: hypothetical protein QW594_00975 [Candidatus Woesearchaeota archaeon]
MESLAPFPLHLFFFTLLQVLLLVFHRRLVSLVKNPTQCRPRQIGATTRAEVGGNIIMYLMAGLVVIVVIGFGVKQMISLSADVTKIQCIEFQQSFKERIIKDRSYGTVDKKPIAVDCPLSQVCFVGEKPISFSCTPLPPSFDPIVCDTWASGIRRNVFLLGEDGFVKGSFYVEGIRVKNGLNQLEYLCLDVDAGGTINPVLRGKGKEVQISPE